VIGEAALTLSLDLSQARFDSIIVPGDYMVEFDNRGFPVEFGPAPAPASTPSGK